MVYATGPERECRPEAVQEPHDESTTQTAMSTSDENSHVDQVPNIDDELQEHAQAQRVFRGHASLQLRYIDPSDDKSSELDLTLICSVYACTLEKVRQIVRCLLLLTHLSEETGSPMESWSPAGGRQMR